MKTKHTELRAFTLIELLVVIAIMRFSLDYFCRAGQGEDQGARHSVLNNLNQLSLSWISMPLTTPTESRPQYQRGTDPKKTW